MANTHDKENMEQIILDSPAHLQAGLHAARTLVWQPPDVSHILFAGMGGSWMAAALLKETGMTTIPVSIHRSYGLPQSIPEKTLIIASSYSGNTEEVLSVYEEARSRNIPTISIASGGTLGEWSTRDNVPFFRIPADPPSMQPRSATGYSVGILIEILSRLNGISKKHVAEAESLEEYLTAFQPTARDLGEELATVLSGTTPILYASSLFTTVARIWKIKINENAKTPAFWNVFPELNHNEMIGWTRPNGTFHVVMLRSNNDHPRVITRMNITADLLQEHGIHSTVIPIQGDTRLQEMFSTLLVGDWASWRMAIDAKVDPSPVSMVEDLKQRLKG